MRMPKGDGLRLLPFGAAATGLLFRARAKALPPAAQPGKSIADCVRILPLGVWCGATVPLQSPTVPQEYPAHKDSKQWQKHSHPKGI